nr:hypothetical protein [Brevundimonas diminuta]
METMKVSVQSATGLSVQQDRPAPEFQESGRLAAVVAFSMLLAAWPLALVPSIGEQLITLAYPAVAWIAAVLADLHGFRMPKTSELIHPAAVALASRSRALVTVHLPLTAGTVGQGLDLFFPVPKCRRGALRRRRVRHATAGRFVGRPASPTTPPSI